MYLSSMLVLTLLCLAILKTTISTQQLFEKNENDLSGELLYVHVLWKLPSRTLQAVPYIFCVVFIHQ